MDGVDNQGIIYEFHGCLFHGCVDCFPRRDTKNPVNGVTMEELRAKTHYKTEKLRAMGFNVIEKWECEFKKEVEENQDLKGFYSKYEPYFEIDPRHAFFGGRTNAVQLFCQPQDGTSIRYVDFTR